MLNGVLSLFMFIFFIVFNISKPHVAKKYVICTKTITSPFSLFTNKHIILLNKGFNTDKSQHLTLFNTIFIYKKVQCIALLCIPVLPLQSYA